MGGELTQLKAGKFDRSSINWAGSLGDLLNELLVGGEPALGNDDRSLHLGVKSAEETELARLAKHDRHR
jgi:hypothetical protein